MLMCLAYAGCCQGAIGAGHPGTRRSFAESWPRGDDQRRQPLRVPLQGDWRQARTQRPLKRGSRWSAAQAGPELGRGGGAASGRAQPQAQVGSAGQHGRKPAPHDRTAAQPRGPGSPPNWGGVATAGKRSAGLAGARVRRRASPSGKATGVTGTA